MAELRLPFEGVPEPWFVLFCVAFAVIVAMLAWTSLLFVRGQRFRLNPPRAEDGIADRFCWVFVIPALNEEVTIRDSVAHVLALPLADRLVVVVDDGSEDRTPEVLAEIDDPALRVLRRDPPEARKGKAAALNHAYRDISELHADDDRSRVIVCVVDADGRLDAEAARFAASHFVDPEVGGVQSLVRIYNRDHLLTWFQDLEFSIYGFLFQAGRNRWGTAGMGGNAQFNRLSAIDDMAGGGVPWHDRLTEDQDLGLRLIAAGWKGRQELRGFVEQQGIPKLRALFRQRTRWSQGNLQAISLARSEARARLPLIARAELLVYLLMPLWQGIVGAALIASIGLAIAGEASFWDDGPRWELVVVYLFGFGGTMLGCIAARSDRGPRGWLAGLLIGQVYAFYSWILWPVLVRSTTRQLEARRDWAKTAREPIEEGAVERRPGDPIRR